MDTISDDKQLISQGAEARVWKVQMKENSQTAILKERFSKAYRHPTLDERLTKSRCKGEARILEKCLNKGVLVPAVHRVEPPLLFLEYLEGITARDHLEALLDADDRNPVHALARDIGTIIAQLHTLGVTHGDLTTSNMMLVDNHKLYLIDFGLAKNTTSHEERAVDLYVLERALSSTHPRLPEDFLDRVLKAYEDNESTGGKGTLKRLDQVRQRGRKRECFG